MGAEWWRAAKLVPSWVSGGQLPWHCRVQPKTDALRAASPHCVPMARQDKLPALGSLDHCVRAAGRWGSLKTLLLPSPLHQPEAHVAPEQCRGKSKLWPGGLAGCCQDRRAEGM